MDVRKMRPEKWRVLGRGPYQSEKCFKKQGRGLAGWPGLQCFSVTVIVVMCGPTRFAKSHKGSEFSPDFASCVVATAYKLNSRIHAKKKKYKQNPWQSFYNNN